MSRPTDWVALRQGSDPVPGDWSNVSSAATRYAHVADAIDRAKRDLLRVFNDEQLSGEAIDAVRETAVEVADRIGRAKERYRGVAEALGGYVEPLRLAQDESLTLLNHALEASADRSHAQHELQTAEYELHQAMATGDQAAMEQAKRTYDRWDSRVSNSNDDIAMAITRMNAIMEQRDGAANRAAGLIEDVENSGGLNDGFWDNVDQFYDENPWIDEVIKYAGYVAAALAVIAMFVPGLNVLVLVVSIVVAAAVIANAWAKAGTGRESIAQAVTETVLAVIPFGVGKVFSAVGKTAVNGVTSSAASSIMHSAAGSGISGITKPIATSVVEQFLARGPATTLTSKFGELLNLAALAKAPILLSGGVGTGLSIGAAKVAGVFGLELAYTASGPKLGEFIGDLDLFKDAPKNSWRDARW